MKTEIQISKERPASTFRFLAKKLQIMFYILIDDASIVISLNRKRRAGNTLVAVMGGLDKINTIKVISSTLEKMAADIKNDIDKKTILGSLDSPDADKFLKSIRNTLNEGKQ